MNQSNSSLPEQGIDLKAALLILWSNKFIILFFIFIFSVASVVYAISLPNIYRSQILLVPSEDSDGGGLASLASQFGGIASLAGINLNKGGIDKTSLALEKIKTKSFIKKFISDNDLASSLMGAKGWDMTSNKLIYNPEIYDINAKKWVREVSPPFKAKPSDLELYEYFMTKNLGIMKDKESGVITISINNYSPFLAKTIVTKIVAAINEQIKQEDIDEANRSIDYLTIASRDTPLIELKKVFHQLIEQQIQTKMLASARKEYVLKTIDEAITPELKYGPKRALICILGALLGSIIGVLVIVVRVSFFTKELNDV
jgi:uncharacterized protein involved in exopolysaccharide biosynthesis